MSDAVVIAIIAGLTTAIPIIVTQIAGIIISMRGRDRVEQKADVLDKKLDTIHTQTNSNLTEQKKLVQDLTEEVKALRKEKDEKAGADSKSL